MLENIIAASVALVVGGGLLTLVYRIVRGDRSADRANDELAALAQEKSVEQKKKKKKKKK